MRGERHTIDGYLESLGTFLSCLRPNLFFVVNDFHHKRRAWITNLLDDRLDVYHRSEDIRTGSDCNNSRFLRDQRQKIVDVVGYCVWVDGTHRGGVPILEL